MKHNRKHQLFGWLSASALLLTTACTSVADLDVAQVDNHDQNVVTLTVRPQSLASGMRDASEGEGDIDLDTQNKYIGRGQNIDVLIYTVYELDEDGKFKPTENKDLIKGCNVDGFEVGKGQSVVLVNWNDNSCKVRLVLKPDKKYKVAFWAQSKDAKDVFDATDLENVHVIYDNAKNNDELRDAFCAVSDTIVSSIVENVVTLRRPFAQINVGTTGADYKNILMASQVYPNKPVTQSKIKLEGVAEYLNVVTGQTVGETTTAEFNYGVIPAFMEGIPDITETDGIPDYSSLYNGKYDKEEYLKVDLDGDKRIAAYKINYPTLYVDENGRKYLTETFKYLSMCYALVPASTSTGGESEGASAVLTKVEVSFAETDEKNEAVNEYTPITLTHVPVHRNWRTNILGGLAWVKDPTDPDDPGYPGKPEDPDPNDPDDPWYPDIPTPDPEDPSDPTPPTPPTPPDGPDDPSSVFGLVNVQIIQQPFYYDEDNEDLGEPADNGEYNLSKDGPSEEEEPEVDKKE